MDTAAIERYEARTTELFDFADRLATGALTRSIQEMEKQGLSNPAGVELVDS